MDDERGMGEARAAEEERGLGDDELKGLIAQEISAALGSWQSELSERRAEALDRYMGELYGDEQEGYSQVVSRDIFEAVEQILPDLLETFVGGDEVVRVTPYGEKDEEASRLRTKRLNYAFLCENDGFVIAYDWMKDALIQGNGVVKYWVDEQHQPDVKQVPGVPSMGVGMLLEAGARVLEYADNGDDTFDLTVDAGKERRSISIQCVPNEEFGIDRRASSIKTARFVCHVTVTTAGALRDLGYPEDLIALCPGPDRFEESQEREAREALEDGGNDISDLGTVSRKGADEEKEIAECYLWVDYDGDGSSELRRVIVGGRQASVIFANDVVSFIPFATLSPIRIPHRFHGMGIADALADIARINTVLKRGYLDSLYSSIRPRWAVLSSQKGGPMADMDELDQLRPGGTVQEFAAGAIRPLESPDVSQPALAGLEFVRGLREERIGVTRMATGLSQAGADAETKLHGTAKGLLALMAQQNKRVGLIARLMAETGWKDLFSGIYRLLQEIEDGQFAYRGQVEEAPPELFTEGREIKIAVGLGYGDKMERFEGLMHLANLMERAAQVPGVGGVVVTPKHFYNLADEICEVLGYHNQNRFFADPEQAGPAPEPPPEAWAVEVAAKERMHAEDLRLKELEIRLEYDYKNRELLVKAGMEAAQANLEAEAQSQETNLPVTATLVPGQQSQAAAEPGGAQETQVPPPEALR